MHRGDRRESNYQAGILSATDIKQNGTFMFTAVPLQ
jgi:hypothetical protein